MNVSEGLLVSFLFRAREQPQIGATHICLYAALVGLYEIGGEEPLYVRRNEVLALAKISPATYHKCLRVLIDCGFVVYYPSPKGKSTIYFLQ